MKKQLTIIHVTDIANPNGNGVAVAVSSYLRSEGKLVNAASYALGKTIPSSEAKHFSGTHFCTIKELPEPFNSPDLVVFHEIYKTKYIALSKECAKNQIKYIIVPHGSLNKKAQQEKKIKKIIANKLMFNSFVKNADAIQFLTKEEQESSIYNGKHAIISGNGVDSTISNGYEKQNEKRIVYIGRYQTKVKGLDILVKIIGENQRWFRKNNVKIDLYGRDSSGGKEEIEELVSKGEISDIISINDAVYDKDKIELLRKSCAYIQLSRREGQPMSIIEALSCGLPCIVSTGTNFADYVNRNKCGFGCLNEAQIIDSIKTVCLNDAKRKRLSDNAIKAAKRDFLLGVITEKKISQYEEIAKC